MWKFGDSLAVRHGPRWWPAKALYWLGWIVVAQAIVLTIGVSLWVVISLVRLL